MEWAILAAILLTGAVLAFIILRQPKGDAGDQVSQARLEDARARVAQLESENAGLREQVEQSRLLTRESQVRAESAAKALEEERRTIKAMEQELKDTFAGLAAGALDANGRRFLEMAEKTLKERGNESRLNMEKIVEPLSRNLEELGGHVRNLEQKREGAYKNLEGHLLTLAGSHREIVDTTTRLNQALKSSATRGKWGEVKLRRIVEMAGMVEHVDFDEQTSGDQGRPDMVVHLSQGGVLPVDAKAPMTSYLAALESNDSAARKAGMAAHAKALRERVRDLGSKAYWKQFGDSSPEFVVMFLPSESAFEAAFVEDGTLLEYALDNKVLPAAPISLLAVLKATAYGWQQNSLTENARLIAQTGKELYDRVHTFLGRYAAVGERLDRAVDAYNKSLGSVERMVLPKARELGKLGAGIQELPQPESIERQARETRVVPEGPPDLKLESN